jgi:acetyl esterase/lipase
MKLLKFNQILKRDLDQHTIIGTSKKPHAHFKKVGNVDRIAISDRDVFIIKPQKEEKQTWVIYLHGGAYVHGFQSFHWRFLKTIMKKTGWNIIAPDYPLLPESSSKAMYAMIQETYQYLLDHENPKTILFMGDSAGGGLALGFAQWLKLEKMRTPDTIILLSPWLDVTMTDPKIKNIEPYDPILNVEALRQIGLMLASNENQQHYLFSPLYGDLKDIGKIFIFSGTYDLLYVDALSLSQYLARKNITHQLFASESMVHTFMFFGLPESNEVIKLITQAMNAM